MSMSQQDHFLSLQPGAIVNGRYEIVRCLGTGSMGMVYACRHRELSGHLVAMKVLFAEVARDSVAAARFRNEIVASYGVSHPNVVRAYEYFRDGDLIAFTMEFIEGGDLADRINSDDQLEIDEIIHMLSQMCSGVQAIHDAGIVHRDLKPENILLAKDGNIKITDFGIARTGTGPKLTEHGGVVGTLDYVSPEYLEKGQVDARSDIYALGVLAYEMLTSQSPFTGKSVIETMTMRLRTDPDPPETIRRDCPKQLGEIVLKAMRRDPEKRYQAAREMLKDLENLQRSTPSSSNIVVPSEVKREAIPSTDDLFQKPSPSLAESNWAEDDDLQSDELSAASYNSIKSTPSVEPRSIKEQPEEPEDYFTQSGSMESVFHASQSNLGTYSESGSNITVSNSHLSAQRIQELSHDIYPEGEGFFGKILWYFLIVFIGLGAGLFVLHMMEPELFGGDQTSEGTFFETPSR